MSIQKKHKHALFEELEENVEKWRDDWQGMPEFEHEDLRPWMTIKVHFESEKDRDEFSKLVDQKITAKTQSIWFPKAEKAAVANKRYVDTE